MDVYFGSAAKKILAEGKEYSTHIGHLEAALDEKMAKAYKLGAALRRLGRALAKQQSKKYNRHVIGIELHYLAFNLILGPEGKNSEEKGGKE